MENGYKFLWTDNALQELQATITYLEENWTEKEIRNFAAKLDNTLQLIKSNPELFPNSDYIHIRRAVVTKHNIIYYSINERHIEIISLFSTQQNSSKRKLK